MKKILTAIAIFLVFASKAQTPGSLDASFDVAAGPDLSIYAMKVQADGKILIGGNFGNFGGFNQPNLVRLNQDGDIDFSFNTDSANAYITIIDVQNDGKIILGKELSGGSEAFKTSIYRVNPDGTYDNTFSTGLGFDNLVNTVAIQNDGKIVVGGSFTNYDGNATGKIVRLNSDGSIDNSFNTGAGFDFDVSELAIQTNGKIVVGGDFADFNGTARSRIARLNSDGSLDTSFDPAGGFDSSPNCIIIQPDGKILVSGWFFDFNSVNVNHLVRLNSDGSADATFNSGTSAENPPYDMLLQADGKIIIGGSFFDYYTVSRNNIARINTDGTLDTSFDPGTGADNTVGYLAFQSPGKILAAGDFVNYNSTVKNQVVRLYSAETIDITSVSDTIFCAGNSFTVSYTQTGTYNSGNNFRVELSDANGDFSSPTVIGSLTSTSDGTINATIPTNTTAGTGYRVRVSSTNPATYSLYNDTDIQISVAPTANAGTDQNICINNSLVTLSGSRTIATGSLWTSSGTGTFANQSQLNTTYTPSGTDLAAGTVTLTLTTTGNGICAAATDQMVITLTNAPTVNAGADISECADVSTINLSGSVTVAAAGAWTTSGTGTFANANSINTTYTPSAADIAGGSVVLTLTSTGNGNCNAVSDPLTITFMALPNVSGGTDQSLCLGNGFTPTGSGALTYLWNNGLTNNTPVVPTSTGTTSYTVTGTDANGCTNTDTINVTVNPLPTVSGGADRAVCLDGKITLNGSGASTYTWDNGITDGVPFTPSSAGVTTYTVTGTDANACSNTASVTVTVYSLPSVSAGADVDVCFGNSVTLTASGAVNYIWSNRVVDGEPFVPTAVGTLSYTVTGVDANSCTNTDVVSVNVLDLPLINVTKVNTNCTQNIGKITATVTGNSPFTYIWSNGSNSNIADSLVSGLYYLQVADNNGCQSTTTAEITSSDGPVVSLVSQSNVTCHGGNDGSISVNITGGTGAYYTSWTTGETATTLTGLSAGTYIIFVSDSMLCETVKEFVITEPDPITTTFTATPATCGTADGSITASAAGGTGSYTYLWSANAASQATATATNLNSGIYSVTITDANTCTATFSYMLETNSPGVTLQTDSVINGTCSNPQGAIYVTVTSGTATSYLWSNGSTTEDISGVVPGTYTLLVTDASGCTSITGASVTNTNNYVPQICMVTVDSTTFDNQIIWEKVNGKGVAYFNIYCEIGSFNDYQVIATIPYNDFSVFTHIGANPNVKSWKYKISSVDSCGNESPLSDYHKTIHLQAVPSGTLMQLSWDNYDGFSYSTYAIYRSDAPYTTWTYVDNLAYCGASVCYNSYTDSPPSSSSIYMIEIDHPTGCNPSKASSKTRSNIRSGNSRMASGLYKQAVENANGIMIYPNPANDVLNVISNNSSLAISIRINNLIGENMLTKTIQNNEKVELSELAAGMYIVELEQGNTKTVKKLVVK